MSRRFAVFDIDGTIFRSALYIEVITELIECNLVPLEVLEEFKPAYLAWKERLHTNSYDHYIDSVVESYEKHLEGIKEVDFDKAAHRVIRKQKDRTYTYTRDLIQQLKNDDYYLIAISGSQRELVERFANYWGFDEWVAQRHEVIDGALTGRTFKTHQKKGPYLAQLIERNNLTLEKSYAVGDSMGDVELLEMVEIPIAFNPDKALFEHAKSHDWQIVVERKNVHYELKKTNLDYTLTN